MTWRFRAKLAPSGPGRLFGASVQHVSTPGAEFGAIRQCERASLGHDRRGARQPRFRLDAEPRSIRGQGRFGSRAALLGTALRVGCIPDNGCRADRSERYPAM